MIDFDRKIIVIAGPTASGKSDIGIRLAKEINGYIINGDSRQIYKELDIGTAKPIFDKKIKEKGYILDGVKHFLYDYIKPKDNFSLYKYQKDVNRVLSENEGIPILLGGTGLYIDSVVFNYDLVENKKDIKQLENKDIKELQNIAKSFINEMNDSDRNNRHRLVRAIQRGNVNTKKGKMLNHLYFVIDLDKDMLIKKVKERIDKMFSNGLLQENISLIDKGYSYSDSGMNSIGYIEFKEYFEGKISIEEVKEKIFKNTMSYIKRQKTWFRRNKKSIWTSDYNTIYQNSSNFISNE